MIHVKLMQVIARQLLFFIVRMPHMQSSIPSSPYYATVMCEKGKLFKQIRKTSVEWHPHIF